jgi:hypothetical protein
MALIGLTPSGTVIAEDAELVEPWPAALRRRRLLTVSLRTPAARRA